MHLAAGDVVPNSTQEVDLVHLLAACNFKGALHQFHSWDSVYLSVQLILWKQLYKERESPPWRLLKSFKGLSLHYRRGDVGFGRSGRWGAGGVLMKDKIKLHNSKCEIQCIWSPTGCRGWTFRPFFKVLVSFAPKLYGGTTWNRSSTLQQFSFRRIEEFEADYTV